MFSSPGHPHGLSHIPEGHTEQTDRLFDIDESYNLDYAVQAISSGCNRNFLVDFSNSHAWAGLDLDRDTVIECLEGRAQREETSTRWIDISYLTKQKELVMYLARRYNFSPRLLAMMLSEPRPSETLSQGSSSNASVAESISKNSYDNEETGLDLSEFSLASSHNPARSGNLHELLDEVWHYTSVDQAATYLCLGYNSIYRTGDVPLPLVTKQSRCPLPACIRVWTWLILTDDNTVISINDDVFPATGGSHSPAMRAVFMRTKQNLLNVFRSLSLVNHDSLSPASMLPIRKHLGRGKVIAVEKDRDACGLLFFYLFENWQNSYSLVTRKDSRYDTELQSIRQEMLARPALAEVDRLDCVSDELSVLKRHYKSYIRIIDHITAVPPLVDDDHPQESRSTARATAASDQEDDDDRMSRVDTCDSLEGNDHPTRRILGRRRVVLRPATMVRFERLKDVITLYALSEVQELLDKAQRLSDMTFSLIAIKESRDVDRLTRVGLLITKATILFLPVNLMTSYFSVALVGVQYTVTQYWVAFAVIMAGSFLVMVGFGVISGTMEHWTFFPGLRTVFGRKMKAAAKLPRVISRESV